MGNVQVTAIQRGNEYTLIGTEGYGLFARLPAAILFAIFFPVSVISLLSPAFFDGDYFNLVDQENLVDELAGDITFFVIIFSVLMLLVIWAFFDKVLDFISASLRLSGAVKFLMDVALYRFLPGSSLVLLIIFAWPLSKFMIAPVVAVIAKSPVGLLLHRILYRLTFFSFTYICFSALVCHYDTCYEYHFDRAADTFSLRWREGFPFPVGFKKGRLSEPIHFPPLFHLRDEIYEFPLSAIRSVHRDQCRPNLALDVLGNQVYLPTVTHKNQQDCDQTLATLANWLNVPQGQDLDAGTRREKVQLDADVLQGIKTRVLPIKGEDATQALLVASALTMTRRNQQRLTRHPDDPDALLKVGIASLGLGHRERGLRQLAEAERQYRLKLNTLKAAAAQKYLARAKRLR